MSWHELIRRFGFALAMTGLLLILAASMLAVTR